MIMQNKVTPSFCRFLWGSPTNSAACYLSPLLSLKRMTRSELTGGKKRISLTMLLKIDQDNCYLVKNKNNPTQSSFRVTTGQQALAVFFSRGTCSIRFTYGGLWHAYLFTTPDGASLLSLILQNQNTENMSDNKCNSPTEEKKKV